MLTTDTYLPTIRKAVLMTTDVMRLCKAIYQPLKLKMVCFCFQTQRHQASDDTSCRIGHAIGIDIKLFEGSPNTMTLKHCPIHLLKCNLGRIGYDIHISSIAKHQDTRNWWKSAAVKRCHFTILNRSFYLVTNLYSTNRVEVSTKECYDIHYVNKANFLCIIKVLYVTTHLWLTKPSLASKNLLQSYIHCSWRTV